MNNLDSAAEVFDYIWQKLSPEIMVYPSEGYYYFSFPYQDQIIKGNLSFFWSHRHLKQINFYYEAFGNEKVSGHLIIDAKDGLIVEENSFTKLTLSWKAKKVVFNFFIPQQLTEPNFFRDWEYQGTALDESGIQFHLMYDKESTYPFWVLDLRQTPSANLVYLSDEIYIHPRSEFLFLKKHNEYVFIGVKKYNIESNNWYDGPSDQMPDFLVYEGKKDWSSIFGSATPNQSSSDPLLKFAYNSSHSKRFSVNTYYRYDDLEIIKELVNKCKARNIFICLY